MQQARIDAGDKAGLASDERGCSSSSGSTASRAGGNLGVYGVRWAEAGACARLRLVVLGDVVREPEWPATG